MTTRTLLLALVASTLALPVAAQEPSEQPITRWVVDLRGAMPKVPSDDALAQPYGLTGTTLPGFGLGVDIGAHVYPLRWKSVTFGVGLSGVIGRAHASPITQSDGTTVGTDVTTRFSAVAPQISFNFGSAAGWSYLSGGLGTARLEIVTPDDTDTVYPRRKTINYGGGGRWFLRDRLAFSFDVRFYGMNPVARSDADHIKQSPRLRMLVISAGVSVR
jgi:hypothetical protein